MSQGLRHRLVTIVTLCIAACAAIWPALYNGQPFFFSDTSAYIRGADAGVQKVTGVSTAWSNSRPALAAPQAAASAPPVTAAPAAQATPAPATKPVNDTVLAGRSVYYGALLYLGHITGDFWLTIWLQALVLVTALAFALHVCGGFTTSRFAVAAGLFCITSGALYACLLMPDVFAAVTILSAAMLLTADRPRERRADLFWFALLSLALLFHSSHVLIASVLLAFGVLRVLLARPRATFAGPGLVVLALVIGVAGDWAFQAGVTRVLGKAPVRPPFITARLIADGPGYSYLKETCPGNGLVVCRYLDRLPLHADRFLWDGTQKGVFMVVDPATQRALTDEQTRFLLAVLRHDFWGQAAASLRNAFNQLLAVRANEFEYWDSDKPDYAVKLPADDFARMQKSAAYTGTMPVETLSLLSALTALLGGAYIVARLLQSAVAGTFGVRPVQIAAFVALGVLVNAAVCGAISGPHNRYEARVIWLIPIIALLLDMDLRRRWWAKVLRRPAAQGAGTPLAAGQAR